jgi:hypothetical protein
VTIVSPLVRKNIRVDNYHRRFILPTDGDDVLLITVASPYDPTVKMFFIASLYDMAVITMLQHNKIYNFFK